MGVGQSNNYSERDFEEKPLEEEEIEKLLEELPSSDKLKSLTGEEKIKILKATSDEKIYNTVGDDIFDYYFTNNRLVHFWVVFFSRARYYLHGFRIYWLFSLI